MHSGQASPIDASAEGGAGGATPGTRDQVIQAVVKGLYSGRYEPGQKLVESEFTASLGISRGPVREAFNNLAAMGVVDLTLQRGAHIRVLSSKDAIDILIIAQGLIAIAARTAASEPQEAHRDRLEHALALLEGFEAADDTAQFARARDVFYGALIGLSGNRELKRVLPLLQVHLVRIQFRPVLLRSGKHRMSDYRRIAQAVLAGQPAAAETAMRKHFQSAIDAIAAFRASERD